MSTAHFRHCPKHRRPLPCAHCELAAKPVQVAVEPENEVSVTVIEIPAGPSSGPSAFPKAKRGRRPKHAVAMTDGERARNKRARRKEKEEDSERRGLVAELMKIYRRQQSKVIVIHRNEAGAEDRRGEDRVRERHYQDDLLKLSVAELKQALAVQKKTVDTHGRLHNERSGELSSKHGESEIETLLAKQNIVHVNMADETADEDIQKTLAATNAQVDTDSDTRVPTLSEAHLEDQLLQKAVDYMISQMRRGPDGQAKCPMCDEAFNIEQAAANHLWEQYGKGEKQAELNRLLKEVGNIPVQVGVSQAHYNRVVIEVEIVRAMLGKTRKAVRQHIANFVTHPRFRS